jgi:thymidylate synthase (FAD)
VNEYSTRYSVAIDAAQRTAPEAWRKQAAENRQGSAGAMDAETGADLSRKEAELQNLSRALYDERLAKGVAREQARKDLPLSTYTEAYWKCDLHNLLHFVALRMDSHAQEEIRAYASVIGEEIIKRWCPYTWEAFLDYHFHSKSFSRLEMEVLSALTSGSPETAVAKAESFGWLSRDEKGLKRHRERVEFEGKLDGLGLKPPWR